MFIYAIALSVHNQLLNTPYYSFVLTGYFWVSDILLCATQRCAAFFPLNRRVSVCKETTRIPARKRRCHCVVRRVFVYKLRYFRTTLKNATRLTAAYSGAVCLTPKSSMFCRFIPKILTSS